MGYSVLIVDDEPDITDGIAFLMKKYCKECEVLGLAYTGEEGYELALSRKPDIVLTDIRMPDMDGLEMIGRLKKAGLSAQFVILSGYAEFDYAKKAISLGVAEFVTKPVEEEELIRTMEKVCRAIDQERCIDGVLPQEKLKGLPPRTDLVSEEDVRRLEDCIARLDNKGIRQVVEEIFDRLGREENLGMQDLKILSLNLLLSGVRKFSFAQFQMNQFLGQNLFTLESIEKFRTLEQLKNWIINTLQGMNDLMLKGSLPEKRDIVEEAKAYIQKNYMKEISLNDISKEFYINPYYFSQLFKKKTGETYQSYLIRLRVERAKRLLEETDLKVYEVCEMVGYADVNHFNRIFEREEGVKPSEYRKRKRG